MDGSLISLGWVSAAGDCRGVVARRSLDGKMYPVSVSFDHNSREKREREVLAEAHPGEEDIVVCPHPSACYVKGALQPTRSGRRILVG
jgi:pyruvate dehydrogenase phosphatase